jgi:DNA helicase HerA-like ATPase/CRISPR/Cas system-associated exonuclease Cas4 (RecB family)
MIPVDHYTVSQVRVASVCPRIHYFDLDNQRRKKLVRPTVTRIWTAGERAQPGGGALFHTVVEGFNRRALRAPEVFAAIERAESAVALQQELLRYINQTCIDTAAFAKRSVELRQSFIAALHQYVTELSHMVMHALSKRISAAQVIEQLFGDTRKRVDVTFHVDAPAHAHVVGQIDYAFFDVRVGKVRILDYKLTPSAEPAKDLAQLYTYALMHHHQHGTQPDVGLFYLHPVRRMIEAPWATVHAERHRIYDLLASMTEWSRFDEATGAGLRPPGNPEYCGSCRWSSVCEKRLGAKARGEREHRWEERAAAPGGALEPEIDVVQPPAAPAPEDIADEDERPAAAASAPQPRASGLVLGAMATGDSEVRMASSVLNTHVAVVGAAGSGKTWMAKVIVEEAIRAGIPVIAIDPQGDLVQFLSRRQDDLVPAQLRAGHRAFWERAEPRVFTPGSSHGIRLALDPIRVADPASLQRIPKVERRKEEEQAIKSAVAANLTALANVGGETESQQTFLYHLIDLLPMTGSIRLRDVIAGLREPQALGIEEPDLLIKKQERERMARKLNAFVDGPAANLFSGGTRLDLDRMIAPTTPGRTPLNVIYLNALTDDAQKQFFVAALAAEVYRWMVTSLEAGDGQTNLLFYIDEARDYIPAGTRKPPAKEPLIRLFTQGRKFGVGCLLCTQSPRSVDYNVFGNCSTKIIGRLEAAQDAERVAEWFATTGPAPAWIASRKGAEKGSFVGRWPDIAPELEGQAFRSRVLYSTHEGAWSPDRVERAVDELGGRAGFP